MPASCAVSPRPATGPPRKSDRTRDPRTRDRKCKSPGAADRSRTRPRNGRAELRYCATRAARTTRTTDARARTTTKPVDGHLAPGRPGEGVGVENSKGPSQALPRHAQRRQSGNPLAGAWNFSINTCGSTGAGKSPPPMFSRRLQVLTLSVDAGSTVNT